MELASLAHSLNTSKNCFLLRIKTLHQYYINDIVGAESCSEKELLASIRLSYTHIPFQTAVTYPHSQLTIENNHIKSH